MPNQKNIDYKETAVNYYLVEDKKQEEVCKVFSCYRRSLMRWVNQHENEGKNESGLNKHMASCQKKANEKSVCSVET